MYSSHEYYQMMTLYLSQQSIQTQVESTDENFAKDIVLPPSLIYVMGIVTCFASGYYSTHISNASEPGDIFRPEQYWAALGLVTGTAIALKGYREMNKE